MHREFRLTNEPGGLGLSCTQTGLALAGIPLLQKTSEGFATRPSDEIGAPMKAAYDIDVSPAELLSGLDSVVRALNRGDLAHATIAAVLMRLPELSAEAAARLAKAEAALTKYDPDQPRNWHGRWIKEEDADSGGAKATGNGAESAHADVVPERQMASDGSSADHSTDVIELADSHSQVGDGKPEPSTTPADANTTKDEQARAVEVLQALYSIFAAQYDDLGAVDFAKAVIQFGYWLGEHGPSLSATDREIALAEYLFLQNRLTLWLSNDKAIEAHGNLLSAAMTLYSGAVNGGIVPVGGPRGGLPPSMLAVGGAAMATDSGPPRFRPQLPSVGREKDPVTPPDWIEPGEEGGIVHNNEAKSDWGRGIRAQGLPFDAFRTKNDPDIEVLPENSKTFDTFNRRTGEAISRKSLYSPSRGYREKPESIYRRLKGYIDQAADYDSPRDWRDLDPAKIRSRTVKLYVPIETSPIQWPEIKRAALHANIRGVKVVITRTIDEYRR